VHTNTNRYHQSVPVAKCTVRLKEVTTTNWSRCESQDNQEFQSDWLCQNN